MASTRKPMALLIHRNGRVRLDIETARFSSTCAIGTSCRSASWSTTTPSSRPTPWWARCSSSGWKRNGMSWPQTPPDSQRFCSRRPATNSKYPRPKGEEMVDLERGARWSLERLLLRYGDDGVLEHLSESPGGGPASDAAELANSLLSRQLYKPAASALGTAAAGDLHKKFGPKEKRRDLEREACEHAEIEHDWHLVLWIPDPDMRLKLAELLVNDGQGVAMFKDKSPRGSDIYEGHKDLWTISVFVHPSVPTEKVRAALAKLGREARGLLGCPFRRARRRSCRRPGASLRGQGL